ncbi:MAG TPA: DHHA1 domain-containing protein [Gemmatimonadaceae bacterium]
MTERLYYTDSYLRDFEARVVARDSDDRRVWLDRTAFYPTSGGQPFDTGTLGGVPVVDVVDESERVAHVLGAALPPGDVVTGHVDWARRFDHMQQHTGQHLLSAVFAELFGLPTESVHFGAASATLDLGGEHVPREQVLAAERRANEVVCENRPVTVSFEGAADAAGLRKASAREGMLRIVTIDRIDRSACGGTHVRATGEIGPILVRKVERVRRATRVEFLCGLRAVRRARADYDALSEAARALSAGVDEVPAVVRAHEEELRTATAARRELAARVHAHHARELWNAAAPDARGVRRIIERRESGALDELRALAQAVSTLPKAVFVGIAAAGGLVIAASEDSGMDAGALVKRVLAETGGRGGGSPRMAQGTTSSVEAAVAALEREWG